MANEIPANIYSIEDAFKNNPELKESDIQIIREWCQKQLHFPKIPDAYLILFLQSNYYQLEPTKNAIENFLTVRTHVPEIFSNRDPFVKELRSQINVVATIPLKENSKHGYKLIFGAITDPDPTHYVFFECIKSFCMITELDPLEKGPSKGVAYVVDVKNFSLGHVARINLMGVKKFLYYVQETIPVRLKHIHILNCNPAVETLLNMCKPFMKKELIEMIHFHYSLKSLEEYIAIDTLPNEFGGKAGNIKDLVEEQIKKLDDNHANVKLLFRVFSQHGIITIYVMIISSLKYIFPLRRL
ncbi:hypothetical protein KPH14_012371 [Odynerus spinipes]|uniref:CRAL-TRIO domain-containing protein n=1 Tax=Odynerus spinipes TaxID=1348599 RepID=A0AAD9RII6_9HYME|nr:hypothetical protein KPH14_012371 [Odynerus spinipes]